MVATDKLRTWGGSVLPMVVALTLLVSACGQTSPEGTTATTEDVSTTTTSTTIRADTTTPSEDDMSPVPEVFMEDTEGGRYHMEIGATSMLRLFDPDSSLSSTEGESVEVIEVAYLTDPGFREWELRAVAAGATTIKIETAQDVVTWELVVRD